MKKAFLLFYTFSILLCSCGTDTTEDKQASTEASLDTESEDSEDEETLLAEAKETLLANPEIKEYFEALETAVDAYLKIVEDLAKTGVDMEASGNEDDLSAMMNGIGNMANNTQAFAKSMDRVKELEEKSETLKQTLGEYEAEAFALMYADIMSKYLKMANNVEEYAEEQGVEE